MLDDELSRCIDRLTEYLKLQAQEKPAGKRVRFEKDQVKARQQREMDQASVREAQHKQHPQLEEHYALTKSRQHKHRFAQSTPEPDRSQQTLQRDQEVKSHDQRLQLLRRNAHDCPEKHLPKQQEMTQLYRDSEPMNGDRLQQSQKCQRLERALHCVKDTLQAS